MMRHFFSSSDTGFLEDEIEQESDTKQENTWDESEREEETMEEFFTGKNNSRQKSVIQHTVFLKKLRGWT